MVEEAGAEAQDRTMFIAHMKAVIDQLAAGVSICMLRPSVCSSSSGLEYPAPPPLSPVVEHVPEGDTGEAVFSGCNAGE